MEAVRGSIPQALLADKIGSLNLDTGQLTPDQVNLMLTHLPIDISFVNENDEVAYYSASPDRIFPRSPGVIGRKVQNCHPPKSMDMVQKILDAVSGGQKRHCRLLDPDAGEVPADQVFRNARRRRKIPRLPGGKSGCYGDPEARRTKTIARLGVGRFSRRHAGLQWRISSFPAGNCTARQLSSSFRSAPRSPAPRCAPRSPSARSGRRRTRCR